MNKDASETHDLMDFHGMYENARTLHAQNSHPGYIANNEASKSLSTTTSETNIHHSNYNMLNAQKSINYQHVN